MLVPVKSSAGRDSLSQTKVSLPPFFGALFSSAPPSPRNQERGLVPGIGRLLNDCSKPGTGWFGGPPAPLSNRIRTRCWLSKAAFAVSKVGWSRIGSWGSVTPGTPIAVA